MDVQSTTEKALPQKPPQPQTYWPNWPSAAVTLPQPEPPLHPRKHLLTLSSTHLFIFQEKNSSAMRCNHQLSMLILVQNIDFFQENKAPSVAPRLMANVLMQYTLNLVLLT